jgi:hypothetical protein
VYGAFSDEVDQPNFSFFTLMSRFPHSVSSVLFDVRAGHLLCSSNETSHSRTRGSRVRFFFGID